MNLRKRQDRERLRTKTTTKFANDSGKHRKQQEKNNK